MLQNLINRIDAKEKRSLFLFIFLLVWLLINIVQSAITELAHDEAYYWMYSRNLAWGYFDHPPMIALLIRLGNSIIPNELGVRMLTSIMGTLTIFIIYCLIDLPKKSLLIFILLVCQIILMHSHIGGFLAIPDIPVVFFSALFLLVYKKYLEKDNYWLSLLLAIIAALMLYSKYHGILLMFFTLVANIKIVKRVSFWVIPLVAAILFVPHLLWQINNGFPTLEYHLFTRSSSYKIGHTINYLYSQFLIAGPLVSLIVFIEAFGYKAETVFDRVLKVNLIGILAFFFLSSFKGHVEAHWTAIAFIPLAILAYKGSIERKWSITWLKRLFLPSILIFLIIRILLVVGLPGTNISVLNELHGWKKWTAQIDSLAMGRKVVFVNSFQRPAKYSFYTGGKFAHTLNNINYRKNQYDIWSYENSLQHQPVLLLQSRQASDSIMTATGEKYGYQFIDDFVSYHNLKIIPENMKLSSLRKDTIPMKVSIFNPRKETIVFRTGDRIVISYHNGKRFQRAIRVYNLNMIKVEANDSLEIMLKIPSPAIPGNYNMYISIVTLNQYPALNCPPVSISIK